MAINLAHKTIICSDIYVMKNIIIESVIQGLLWAFTYYYIRRGLNPETKNKLKTFRNDTIYGGVAMAAMVFLRKYIKHG